MNLPEERLIMFRRLGGAKYCQCALLAFCAFTGSPAVGASPSVASIAPRGGQRGTEAVLLFIGARLSDAKEIHFYSPGFTVNKLEIVNDGQVKATVAIATDCRLGEHAMRLRSATGISELRTFFVGALPVVEEKEPNSDFAAPQKIPINVTVHGVVQSEDVDYFVFDAKKGQRVSAEVEAMRLGGAPFDPYLAILDAKRFELATSDDAPLLGQDAVVSVVIPADGTYYVQIRDSAYGGDGSYAYRLHVGTFPRPAGVLPAGGKLGEEIEVRFLGDPAGDIAQKVRLPAFAIANFGVHAQDAGGVSPSAIPFRLSEHGNILEAEPNDSHTQATKAELALALNGVIGKPGDVDHFRFSAKKGQVFDVRCYARRLGSPLDSVMTLSHFGGAAIIANDDAGGPDSSFRFTVPEDKEYILTVNDHLGKGGPAYFYRVEFTPVAPLLSLTIAKVAPYSQERQAVAVPRGNRYVALVAAERANFGGDLNIGADALPQGMTVSADQMAANVNVAPMLFEAVADAPLAGALAKITARHADPKQKLEGGFIQTVELVVAAPNQSVYWVHNVDRLAVAVTEEAPFKIGIVEPKVPLVQNGSMNLKVVAERKPGFKAPITIVPVYSPPGVGTASSVTIPEEQNEVLLPLNASSGAPARKWKFAVNGVATVGNGPIWVGSQLATVEVAAPYLSLAMERTAVEQGKSVELFCKVQTNKPFEGKATARLLGLLPKVSAPELEITKDTKELAFKVDVDKAGSAGQHKTLFCQVSVVENGEPILHNLGGTELRIDVPLPAKTEGSAGAAKPEAAASSPKRLTRLEQLRLEQDQREKAGRKNEASTSKK